MEKYPNSNDGRYSDAKKWFTGAQEELAEERGKYHVRYNEKVAELYAKEGRLREYELSRKLHQLEMQKLETEHELTIARQDRERRERIAKFEERQRRGEELSLGSKLQYEIDKELEVELNKTQEDYDREESQQRGRLLLHSEDLERELAAGLSKTQEDYDKENEEEYE